MNYIDQYIEEMKQITEKINKEEINKILYEKFPIKEIKFCPHDDKDNCNCRKPKPGKI